MLNVNGEDKAILQDVRRPIVTCRNDGRPMAGQEDGNRQEVQ